MSLRILYFCTDVHFKKQKIEESGTSDGFSDVYLGLPVRISAGTHETPQLTRYLGQYVPTNSKIVPQYASPLLPNHAQFISYQSPHH